MKKLISFSGGLIIGLINILLGAGAGTVAVLILKKQGLSQKEAQANALMIILPTTLISLIIYFFNGHVNFYDNIFIIIPAALGAFAGTFLLSKISADLAKKLLGAFTLFAGIRLLSGR